MDIFTTVLTRVVPVPIKPARLRVKALAKEPSTNELTDDLDHLENHEQYVDLFENNSQKQKEQNKEKQQQEQQNAASILKGDSDINPDDNTAIITHKDELIHPKKHPEEPDEDIHHLDIFI